MNLRVIVETSARHVHLSKEHMDILFGKDAVLTAKRPLTQPGQFLSEERVSITGSKKSINNIAILGPERSATQVELSLTDARSIGVDAPVRESGNIAGSGAIKITGPAGEIEITEGVIAAKRHIHVTPEDAEKFGLSDKEIVSVRITDGERKLTFDDVVCRISPKFATYMHVDTDEANAAGLCGTIYGEVIK